MRLSETVRGTVLANEPMSRHTSFRIGGPADALVVPEDREDLVNLLEVLSELQVPFYVMGAGTNLLVRDEGVRGVVIKMAGVFSDVTREEDDVLRSGAGAHLPTVCREAALWGLAGLEFASGIPGTTGGAVAMNAGAYGSCICDFLRVARAVTYEGRQVELTRDELEPELKATRVLREPLILIEADFGLRRDDPAAVLERMQRYLEERSRRQPLALPSAGCAFKNPAGGGAGRFIDAAGLKGARVGGAEVSCVHANFIVNTGGATANDVLCLMEKVRDTVYSRFGVVLETELKILGG